MTPSDANVIPVKVLQDESSHWYVIPAIMVDQWIDLTTKAQKAAELDSESDPYMEFNNVFSQYMTGGDINNIQLFAQL